MLEKAVFEKAYTNETNYCKSKQESYARAWKPWHETHKNAKWACFGKPLHWPWA